jgi:thiosulfate reductase cytochrome b subunit
MVPSYLEVMFLLLILLLLSGLYVLDDHLFVISTFEALLHPLLHLHFLHFFVIFYCNIYKPCF